MDASPESHSSDGGAASFPEESQPDAQQGIRYSKFGSVATPPEAWAQKLGVDVPPAVALTASAQDSARPEVGCQLQYRRDLEQHFTELSHLFGFQQDNARNQLHGLLTHLESRMATAPQSMDALAREELAIRSLHREMLSGPQSNFYTWYFELVAAFMGEDFDVHLVRSTPLPNELAMAKEQVRSMWIHRAHTQKTSEYLGDLALWMLIWGEAANLRFCPEVLCCLYKFAQDHWHAVKAAGSPALPASKEGAFLETAITPLYNFLRDELYRNKEGRWVRKSEDHSSIVGYDDLNELFWSVAGLRRLRLRDGRLLLELPKEERYTHWAQVIWNCAHVRKTYLERRTPLHLLVNFTPIWIAHLSFFFYFLVAAVGEIWAGSVEQMLVWFGLGGMLSVVIVLLSLLVEPCFVPMRILGAKRYFSAVLVAFVLLVGNAIIPVLLWNWLKQPSTVRNVLIALQITIAMGTTVFCIVRPRVLGQHLQRKSRLNTNFPPMPSTNRVASICLWLLIAGSKLVASYFYVVEPFQYTFQILFTYRSTKDCGTSKFLCGSYPSLVLSILLLLNVILFHLDTYIWYIVWTTVLGIVRAFQSGISGMKPWRSLFLRLPDRLQTKLTSPDTPLLQVHQNPDSSHPHDKTVQAKLWNAIVWGMFRDHLLSTQQCAILLYKSVQSTITKKSIILEPRLFAAQEDEGDGTVEASSLAVTGEAKRRISFLAQSLATSIPECPPVEYMPTFTVLTPHYGEKIILSLRQVIYEGKEAGLTLLEYLKALYPAEWDNFVEDSKLFHHHHHKQPSNTHEGDIAVVATDGDHKMVEFSTTTIREIGFQTSDKSEAMRTRLWASLRSQTLFRTIAGFACYADALVLQLSMEHPELSESQLRKQVYKKFHFVVAVQRYEQLGYEELEDIEFLLASYPFVKIAYLETEKVVHEEEGSTEMVRYYSCLLDASCARHPENPLRRKPYYRIRLPGLPILGDGKSDNQNHAIIYTRGDYIQLIDANQDQYLEEALKIRNLLSEFQTSFPLTTELQEETEATPPVAIVGAREHIFSERIGSLGDVAAGKEYTFGTITQRVMSFLGARSSYGHPDIMNRTFMMTRGGISKGQKGLHLNEDIYAGMNAFMRGGLIKHSEYIQCGKGRDLGFSSILGFVSKIGSGMGEQMLSREQYYLGHCLPLDRMCTFYYAHPGFHVNNVLSILAIRLFVGCLFALGILTMTAPICDRISQAGDGTFVVSKNPSGCFDAYPIMDWLQRSVVSIGFTLFISYLPFVLQIVTEFGLGYGLLRFIKQIASLTPVFEVFSTQIYAYQLASIGLSLGGSSYINTGRGFATQRIPFYRLYATFVKASLQLGGRITVTLAFASLLPIASGYLVFFWMIGISLCLAPFLFNPHMLDREEFMVDYRRYLRWLWREPFCKSANNLPASEQTDETWVQANAQHRARFTGTIVSKNDLSLPKVTQSSLVVLLFQEVLVPLSVALCFVAGYAYVKVMTGKRTVLWVALSTPVAFGIVPLLLNSAVLLLLLPFSLLTRVFIGSFSVSSSRWMGSFLASMARYVAVLIFVGTLLAAWMLEEWSVRRALTLWISSMYMQRFFQRLIILTLLPKEVEPHAVNEAWWTCNWTFSLLGCRVLYAPLREFLCKTLQQVQFGLDYAFGHMILFAMAPLLLLPRIDRYHSTLLLWIRDESSVTKTVQQRNRVWTTSEKRFRRWECLIAVCLFLLNLMVFLALLVVPSIWKLPVVVSSESFHRMFS